jgi:hypothetical protein
MKTTIDMATDLCWAITELPCSAHQKEIQDRADKLLKTLKCGVAYDVITAAEASNLALPSRLDPQLLADAIAAIRMSESALENAESANTAMIAAEAIKNYAEQYHPTNAVERLATTCASGECQREFESARLELESSMEAINSIRPDVYREAMNAVMELDLQVIALDSKPAERHTGNSIIILKR